jgi:hypothetical protein
MVCQIARMHGHHRSVSGANRLHGGFSVVSAQTAADDEGAFSRKRQRGFAAYAPAGAGDDANFP